MDDRYADSAEMGIIFVPHKAAADLAVSRIFICYHGQADEPNYPAGIVPKMSC